MSDENLRPPRGMRDILPENEIYWRAIENAAKNRCENLGFSRITTPLVDAKSLFIRSVGDETDIVQKEMFAVKRLTNQADTDETKEDSKEELVLRPEATAQIARAYIQYGMHTLPQPVRLFYLREPMFRYERPQAGRYRQFYQFGAEVLGSDHPMTDALLILLVWQIFQDLKISDKLVVDINSIGCKVCRPIIKRKITEYYKSVSQSLCPDCQVRLKKNPLRLLDCKEEQCQPFIAEAPQIVDNLCEECQTYFRQVLEMLDDLNIPYNLAPQLVRGLDYYTRTVFEFRDEKDTKRQAVLAAGGRYDGLVETLGGHSTPGVGFSLGYERVVEKIKEYEIDVPPLPAPEILLVQLGDKAQRKCLELMARLNKANYSATTIPGKDSLRSQLRMADRLNIPIALIIGQREAFDNTAILRNMKEGVQETVDLKRIEEILPRYIKREEKIEEK